MQLFHVKYTSQVKNFLLIPIPLFSTYNHTKLEFDNTASAFTNIGSFYDKLMHIMLTKHSYLRALRTQ